MPNTKLLWVGAILIVFILFQNSIRDTKSSLQLEFDNWLALKEATLESVSVNTYESEDELKARVTSTPILSLTVQEEEGKDPSQFLIGPATNAQEISYVLRLLELLREANLFSKGEPIEEGGTLLPATLKITIKDGDRHFGRKIHAHDIQGNIQAQLLLRLFKEFAQEFTNKRELNNENS